jgi:hypothetical protein
VAGVVAAPAVEALEPVEAPDVVEAPVDAGAVAVDAPVDAPEEPAVLGVPNPVLAVVWLLVDCGAVTAADAASAASWLANPVGSGAWMFASARPASLPGLGCKNAIVAGEGITIPMAPARRSIR